MGLTGSPSQCLAASLFKRVKACQSRLKAKPGEIPQPQGLSVNSVSPGPSKDRFVLFTILNGSVLKLHQLGVGSAPQDRNAFHVMTPFPNSRTPPGGHKCPTKKQRTGWTANRVWSQKPFNSSLSASLDMKGTTGNYSADWLAIVSKTVIRLRV